MSSVEIVDAGPDGSVVFKFPVTQRYANLNGVVHGGAYGVLFGAYMVASTEMQQHAD